MKIARNRLRQLIKESLEQIWLDRTSAEPKAWNREMKQVKNLISLGEYDAASSYLQDYPDMLYQIARDMTQGKSRSMSLAYYLTQWLPHQHSISRFGEYEQLNDAAIQGMGAKMTTHLVSQIEDIHSRSNDYQRNRIGPSSSDVIVRRKRK